MIGPVKLAFVVTLPEVKPEAVPVKLVATPDAGVPNAGVTNVGEFANTAAPVPVSSVKAVDKLPEVNDPNEAAFPTEVTSPVKFALVEFAVVTKAVVAKAVVLLPAVWVTPMVPVGKVGVPVRVGEAAITKVLPVPV